MRRYKFTSHPHYNLYACHAKNGSQYWLGFVKTDFVVLKFSSEGVFQEITKEGETEHRYFNLCEDMALAWIEQHELRMDTIEVEKFNIPSYGIRIQDLPRSLRDYLQNKADYSEEDQLENEQEIESWLGRQDYVLYWGMGNYWLDRYGEITAT